MLSENSDYSLNQKITEFLLSIPNIGDSNMQQALIYGAGFDDELCHQLTIGVSAVQFVQLLMATTSNYGKLKDGRNALEAVLETGKNYVGMDKQRNCEVLIQKLKGFNSDKPNQTGKNSNHSTNPNRQQEHLESMLTRHVTVFISYNHADRNFAEKLKNELQKHGIKVVIDVEDFQLGDSIEESIAKATRDTDYTILIVSEHSLQSPWIIQEFLRAYEHERVLQKKKFLPVYIDNACFQRGIDIEITKNWIDPEIQKCGELAKEAVNANLDATPYNDEIQRLMNLRNNIGTLLGQLRQRFAADLSTEESFQQNLPKLILSILASPVRETDDERRGVETMHSESTTMKSEKNIPLWAAFLTFFILLGAMIGVGWLIKAPLNFLLERYAGDFRTLVMISAIVGISLIVAVVMFGIMRSTGIFKQTTKKAQYEFGGAMAGFLVTLLTLLSFVSPQSDSLELIGNIRLIENGEIVGVAQNAQIALSQHAGFETQTDKNGNFELNLPEDKNIQSIEIQVTYEDSTTFHEIQRSEFEHVKIEIIR